MKNMDRKKVQREIPGKLFEHTNWDGPGLTLRQIRPEQLKLETKFPFRSNNRDSNSQYSTPPPVVYSNGAAPGAHGSGANNEQNAAAWQEYYKKYYEYYGQYPQGNISLLDFKYHMVICGYMVIYQIYYSIFRHAATSSFANL